MKKALSVIITLFIMSTTTFSQDEGLHISNYFTIEKEINISNDEDSKLVGCGDNDFYMYCSCKAFADKKNDYQATIHSINILTGEESQFVLPFPEEKANALAARNYWIYAINIKDDNVILSTQYAILFYTQTESGKYELTQNFPTDMPVFSYFYKGGVYFGCMDNSMGFRLKYQKLKSDKQNEIQTFEMDAPFLLQYGPNGFLKKTDQYIYFLNSPDFRIRKYDLLGNQLAEIKISLPNWHPMDQDYIQKLAQMEYGGDRAVYSFYHSQKYSFPLGIIPLNDSNFIITYHQYYPADSSQQIEAIILTTNADWTQWNYVPTSFEFPQDHVIQKEEFPVYFTHFENLLLFSTQNRFWQMSQEADIPYVGKTWSDYQQEKQKYYKKNEPIIKLRVLKYKGNTSLK